MFKVKKERCNECLYSKDRVVSQSRAKQVIKDCRRNDSHFQCHKGTINGDDICCRGFYDSESTNLIRIAQRLNMIKFVD